jgi:hypothetical protein
MTIGDREGDKDQREGEDDQGVEKLAHRDLSSPRPATRGRNESGRRVGVVPVAIVAVKALAHFLAGLEERYALLLDRNVLAGARIATWFGQRRWRRSARQLEGELQETRSRLVTAETSLAHLRNSQATGQAGPVAGGQVPYLMGIGRDKSGAPL